MCLRCITVHCISFGFLLLVRQNKLSEDTTFESWDFSLFSDALLKERSMSLIFCSFVDFMHTHIDSVWLIHLNRALTQQNAGQGEREMLPPPWWCIHRHRTSQKHTVFWWQYQAAPGTLWWIVGSDETECLFCECGKKLLLWSQRIIYFECADAGVVSCSCLV